MSDILDTDYAALVAADYDPNLRTADESGGGIAKRCSASSVPGRMAAT
ncbi:MAG: hypothetical protein ACRC8Y_18780 [Chroococcales cyanobacterium]